MSEALDKIKEKMARDNATKLEAQRLVAAQEVDGATVVDNSDIDLTTEEGRRIAAERAKIAERAHASGSPTQPSITDRPMTEETSKELLKLTPEELLKRIRIFRSRIPGSSFVMREGYTIYFTDGWYETSDPSEIKQLDAVANRTPAIHTDEHEAAIIEAIIEARRQGFTGTIGEALTQQMSMEQRIAGLRAGRAPKGINAPPANTLQLPTQGMPAGVTAVDAAKADASLKAAILASRHNAQQSNSN
jgi:hypothetical protein